LQLDIQVARVRQRQAVLGAQARQHLLLFIRAVIRGPSGVIWTWQQMLLLLVLHLLKILPQLVLLLLLGPSVLLRLLIVLLFLLLVCQCRQLLLLPTLIQVLLLLLFWQCGQLLILPTLLYLLLLLLQRLQLTLQQQLYTAVVQPLPCPTHTLCLHSTKAVSD
jgi:hypothetical protein